MRLNNVLEIERTHARQALIKLKKSESN